MKRRELIKLGSAILGSASIGAVAGYGINSAINNEKPEPTVLDKKLSIEPKQTAEYEYSSPMPFDKKLIDKIDKLNQKMTKGKVKVLYSSLPYPVGNKIHPVLDSVRGDNPYIKTVDDYIDVAKYAISKGFKCIYTLNTTRPVEYGEEGVAKAVVPLFEKFYEAGIHDVKIANPAIFELFKLMLPQFDVHLSTTSEYHSTQVYKYLLDTFPNVKTINISTDDNHNFEFLSSLREILPNVKLEILINETKCVRYCIARYYHQCAKSTVFPCQDIIVANPLLHLTRTNVIMPWQLEYFSAIGINNFKFTCNAFGRNNILDISYLKYYLDCVENGVEKFSANDISDKIFIGSVISKVMRFKKNYPLAKMIERLPDMNKLIELGANCANDCGTKCRYCYNCAEKLKDLVEKA